MPISIDAEGNVTQSLISLHDKISEDISNKRNIHQNKKSCTGQTNSKHYIKWCKTVIISSKIKNSSEVTILQHLFNKMLEILARTIR
jgi:hypothetical protein